jgi:hypothetical protein
MGTMKKFGMGGALALGMAALQGCAGVARTGAPLLAPLPAPTAPLDMRAQAYQQNGIKMLDQDRYKIDGNIYGGPVLRLYVEQTGDRRLVRSLRMAGTEDNLAYALPGPTVALCAGIAVAVTYFSNLQRYQAGTMDFVVGNAGTVGYRDGASPAQYQTAAMVGAGIGILGGLTEYFLLHHAAGAKARAATDRFNQKLYQRLDLGLTPVPGGATLGVGTKF